MAAVAPLPASTSPAQAAWGKFLEDFLIKPKACSQAIVINKSDGTMWATTSEDKHSCKTYSDMIMMEDGTEVSKTVDEEKGLLEYIVAFKKPEAGIRIGGNKFTALRTFEKGANDDGLPTVYLKKPKGGGCIVVTERAIIFGVWEEGAQAAAACNDAVEKMGRYLKSAKF